MRFQDREQAARLLAERLSKYKPARPLVLGVPRGAVPMARIVADAIDGDLDVVLVRKLRAPAQPELAIGAVDEAGTVLRGEYFARAGASPEYLQQEIAIQRETLRRRRAAYTRARGPIDPAARVVIIVDDGIATGSSMLAAVRAVRARKPKTLVVAIAVAAPESLERIAAEADEVVCLHSTPSFFAVGQFFDDFSEVTDEMVIAALAGSAAPSASNRDVVVSPSR
jgi:predicted phosphoribosyltransferase